MQWAPNVRQPPLVTSLRGTAWRRIAKLAFFALLLAAGLLILYQQLVVRVSRDAVINARVAVVRAPIDGVATASVTTPGIPIKAGAALGQIADPLPDDSRLFELQREASDIDLERASLAARLTDLARAQADAEAQAEAYRLGRVKELELGIEEASANLAAATARKSDADEAAARGASLHTRGFQSDEAQDKLGHAQEIEHQGVIAALKRLDALSIELDAARHGTFLGDSYNDAPSSLQRARELALQLAEARTALDDQARKGAALRGQLIAERQRLAAHTKAALTAPVKGELWTVMAEPGEYVRKGQEILTVLDCSTVVVTASVRELDYNRLRLDDPVEFRVSGSDRAYSGRIVKLGSSTAYAVPPAQDGRQIVVALSDLPADSEDACAVGRSGEVVFESTGRGVAGHLLRVLDRLFDLS